MHECVMCEKEFEGSTKICNDCAILMDKAITYEKSSLVENINMEYNIHKIDDIPVIECRCTHRPRDLVVFDFFSTYNERADNYNVILCSQCRSCGGYFKFFGEMATNFPLKHRPPHAGFTIKSINEKRFDYII